MEEIERPKENVGGSPQETPKASETPKEPTAKKNYNIFGLIQNILIIAIILGSSYILTILTEPVSTPCFGNTSCILNSHSFSETISRFVKIFISNCFLVSMLFIIIGIGFYINKTDKFQKILGKKFITRGIVGIVLILIIYFIITLIAGLFSIPIACCDLPNLLKG